MKRFTLTRQLISLFFIGLALFALFRYNLNPKLSAITLCKAKEDCIKGLTLSDDGANFLTYSADGKFLFGIGVDGARAWSVDKAYSARRLGTFSPRALATSSDGRYAVVKRNAEINIYSSEGKELLEFSTPLPQKATIYQLAFVTGHDMLAVTKGSELSFWHSQTGELVTSLPHDSSIRSLASSSLQLIAVGQTNGKIILWPISDFSKYQTIKASEGQISKLSFSKDGQLLASADATGEIKLWDTTSKELITSFKNSDSLVTSLSFSDDGNRLAASHFSGQVSLWQVTTASALGTWHYSRSVLSTSLSPDGKHLAIALNDKAEIVKTNKTGSNLTQQEKNFRNTLNDSYVKVSPAVILIRDLSQFEDEGIASSSVGLK